MEIRTRLACSRLCLNFWNSLDFESGSSFIFVLKVGTFRSEELYMRTEMDPLYVIFEQHLFNFQDSDADRKTFIGNSVTDYLT